MKTFISFLGTGLYGECVYTKGVFKSTKTRFIQEATLDYLQVNQWQHNDKIVILLTDMARKNNWDEKIVSRKNFATGNNEPYIGLEKILKDKNYCAEIKGVNIEDGKNEDSMWAIFSCIFNEIRNGDDLYFDLTHSFRYLPMLMLVLGNYSKFIKNTNIIHISYGNYEARLNSEAPIIDLMPLSLLQDWTDASDNFITSGSALKLYNLVDRQNRTARGTDTKINNIRQVVKNLDDLLQEINTCQGRLLYNAEQIIKIKSSIEKTKEKEMPIVFYPLLDKIEQNFESLSLTPSWENVLNASIWCFNHQLYQQSITLLRETSITVLCTALRIDWQCEKCRNQIVSYCKVISEHKKDASHEIEQTIEKVGETDGLGVKHIRFILSEDILTKWALLYMNTAEVRNQYNHAGFLKKSLLSPKKIINLIKKQIENVTSWDNSRIPVYKESTTNALPSFVNISNHHSSKWSKEQKDAAQVFGEIIDIPFPNINPSLDKKGICSECDSLIHEIFEITKGDTNSVIHVMGEMTFTYNLISKLKKIGYTCLASTTKRIVQNNPDGSKTAFFEFVQFRPY